MTSPGGWEEAFVGVTVALGATVDEARLALGGEARARVAVLARALEQPAKEGQARALASALARVAIAVEARLA